MTLQQARSKIEQQLTRPRHDSKSLGNLPTNAHLRSHGRVKISVNNKHDTDRLPEKTFVTDLSILPMWPREGLARGNRSRTRSSQENI